MDYSVHRVTHSLIQSRAHGRRRDIFVILKAGNQRQERLRLHRDRRRRFVWTSGQNNSRVYICSFVRFGLRKSGAGGGGPRHRLVSFGFRAKKKNANLLSSVSSIAVLPRQASCDGLSLFKDVGGLAILERNLLHGWAKVSEGFGLTEAGSASLLCSSLKTSRLYFVFVICWSCLDTPGQLLLYWRVLRRCTGVYSNFLHSSCLALPTAGDRMNT